MLCNTKVMSMGCAACPNSLYSALNVQLPKSRQARQAHHELVKHGTGEGDVTQGRCKRARLEYEIHLLYSSNFHWLTPIIYRWMGIHMMVHKHLRYVLFFGSWLYTKLSRWGSQPRKAIYQHFLTSKAWDGHGAQKKKRIHPFLLTSKA